MTAEEWADIPGYEGTYKVSTHGRVWSAPRRNKRGGPYLKPAYDKGYPFVNLHAGNGQSIRRVHILVMLAFVGPPQEGQEVRHLDGDPGNPHLSNLRYGTKSENMLDQVRHGTHFKKYRTHCPHNHPYVEGNLYFKPSQPGIRRCLTCKRNQDRDSMRRTRARRKAEKK